MGHWSRGGREKPGCFFLCSVSGGVSGVSIFLPWFLQMLFQVSTSVGWKVSQCHLALGLSSEQRRVF